MLALLLALALPAPVDLHDAERALALRIARAALERSPAPAAESALGRPGAAFVTLVLDGATRGCQGTLQPSMPTLADEIAAAARRAAAGDSRHAPLSASEIARARIVIALPGPTEPLARGATLDPRAFGLVAETDDGAGVLLPGEARTFDWMLRECRRRAHAPPGGPCSVRAFRATVFGETALPSLEGR